MVYCLKLKYWNNGTDSFQIVKKLELIFGNERNCRKQTFLFTLIFIQVFNQHIFWQHILMYKVFSIYFKYFSSYRKMYLFWKSIKQNYYYMLKVTFMYFPSFIKKWLCNNYQCPLIATVNIMVCFLLELRKKFVYLKRYYFIL